MIKNDLQNILRHLNLLGVSNSLRFYFEFLKNFHANQETKKKNNLNLPPESLLFEVFAKTSYEKYLNSGREASRNILELIFKHKREAEIQTILDWGCGVARITRHLPEALPNRAIFGIDINEEMIAWCRKNINGVTFQKNDLAPPTSFPNAFFDVVISTSVFTHLSLALQQEWVKEVNRVLKTGGIFAFTLHGKYHASTRLTKKEFEHCNSNGVVIRGKVEEGSKLFGSFHRADFVEKTLIKPLTVLEFIEGTAQQDIWIAQK